MHSYCTNATSREGVTSATISGLTVCVVVVGGLLWLDEDRDGCSCLAGAQDLYRSRCQNGGDLPSLHRQIAILPLLEMAHWSAFHVQLVHYHNSDTAPAPQSSYCTKGHTGMWFRAIEQACCNKYVADGQQIVKTEHYSKEHTFLIIMLQKLVCIVNCIKHCSCFLMEHLNSRNSLPGIKPLDLTVPKKVTFLECQDW